MKSPSPHTAISPERAKHLERNRIAANKCRERKKREHKQIERRLSDETEKKEILLAQLNCLREEVWDLKNIIFQHADCEDQRINIQLAKMTQTVLNGQSAPKMTVPDKTSVPEMSLSPTVSTKTWSDESVDEGNVNTNIDMIDAGALDLNDWTALPKVPNDMVYDPGLTDSVFDNFIDADNLYT
jgi:hypothetical protein